MANIESIPTWEAFMSTAMAENPLLSSEYLGFLIFDYAKFQKEGFQNWIIVQRELNQILQNDVDDPLDFLLNLFRTVIENHKTEFHESEGWDYKRIAFHDERLTEFIGWAKSRFEYLSQDYEKLKQESNNNSEKLKDDNLQPNDLKSLTAFELALRHCYLVKGCIEQYLKGGKVGEKYSCYGSKKNIELAFNDIENGRRKAKLEELQNVLNTLIEYPQIQKALENDIDLIK